MDLPNRAMTLEEVARLLHVPADTMYYLHATGQAPPASKVGRAWRYDPEEFKKWFEHGGSTKTTKEEDR